MMNAGQTCISVERVYVEAPVYDEFVAKVTEKVRALRVGQAEAARARRRRRDHLPPQLDTIKDHVADALAKGARVLTGGHEHAGPGTLLRADGAGRRRPLDEVHDRGDLRPDAADHEGRGHRGGDPPCQRLAYGLGASVFTRDTARGAEIAARIEAGAANVNDALINYTVLELPMGGAKASGLGSRHGAGGIRKFCAQQALVVTPRLALKRDPHMYPYRAAAPV